jgi:hypothetical protein
VSPLKTADEVKELLIQELRALGSASMNEWATQAEERVGHELKGQDATVRSRKKNADVVECLWVGKRARSVLAQPEPELSASLNQYLAHHQCERNHQGLENVIPFPDQRMGRREGTICKAERLGGLLNFYNRAA